MVKKEKDILICLKQAKKKLEQIKKKREKYKKISYGGI